MKTSSVTKRCAAPEDDAGHCPVNVLVYPIAVGERVARRKTVERVESVFDAAHRDV